MRQLCTHVSLAALSDGASAHANPCLDKPVLVRDTHDSKAWYVTAMGMLAMAENQIQKKQRGVAMCGTMLL